MRHHDFEIDVPPNAEIAASIEASQSDAVLTAISPQGESQETTPQYATADQPEGARHVAEINPFRAEAGCWKLRATSSADSDPGDFKISLTTRTLEAPATRTLSAAWAGIGDSEAVSVPFNVATETDITVTVTAQHFEPALLALTRPGADESTLVSESNQLEGRILPTQNGTWSLSISRPHAKTPLLSAAKFAADGRHVLLLVDETLSSWEADRDAGEHATIELPEPATGLTTRPGTRLVEPMKSVTNRLTGRS